MIYLIGNTQFGVCKIGYTANLTNRITSLKTGFPYKMGVLATVKGTRKQETRLHKVFEHLRLEGEWFKYDETILEYFTNPEKLKSIQLDEKVVSFGIRPKSPKHFLKVWAENGGMSCMLLFSGKYIRGKICDLTGWEENDFTLNVKRLVAKGIIQKTGDQSTFKIVDLPQLEIQKLDFYTKRGRYPRKDEYIYS